MFDHLATTCTSLVFDLKTEIVENLSREQRRKLTPSILQSLNGGRSDPHATQKAAAGIFVHFLLVPHGDGDAFAAGQKQVIVGVPFRVDCRLANVG